MLMMLRAGNIGAATNLAQGGDGLHDHHIAGELPCSGSSGISGYRRASLR